MEKKTERLYKIGEHYVSYYDDDYSTILCYDAENKRLCTREWTTAGYCGEITYPDKDIRVAIYEGLVTVDEVASAVMKLVDKDEELHRKAKYLLDGEFGTSVHYNLPCTVKGGRKYQGEAVLIDVIHKPYNWGYGRESFQEVARLLTPDNTIAEATVRFVRLKQTEEELVEKMKSNIADMDGEEMVRLLLKTCGDSGKEFSRFRDLIFRNTFPIYHEYDQAIDDALKAAEDAKQDKHTQWLHKTRTGLLDWCRTTFSGKTEDELQCICDRIMMKKYGETCVPV